MTKTEILATWDNVPHGYSYEREAQFMAALKDKTEVLTLSIGCGSKLDIYIVGEVVIAIEARARRNSWDVSRMILEKTGTYSRCWRGSRKVIEAMYALALRLEEQPLGLALGYYRSVGMCCICGAVLTDQVSRARGIGPECIKKVHATKLMRYVFKDQAEKWNQELAKPTYSNDAQTPTEYRQGLFA